MSVRLSYRTRRRRNWFSQANVRSTTQRHRPKPLPCRVRRTASSGRMWRARSPLRMVSASYARSPSTQSGRHRGRPRSPCKGGIASTRGMASCESCRSHRSSGPRAARRARRKSHGVYSRASPDRLDSDRSGLLQTPLARNNCRPQRATNQSRPGERANPAVRSASDPRCRRVANRGGVANTSFRSHAPAPEATSPTECRCEGQRQCPSDTRDQGRVAVHASVAADEQAEADR
jgi:hypothetical protein